MPEEQRPAGRADEARAERHVGDAVDDRLDDSRKILRVVLQVGVLDGDDVAGRGGEARPQRRALAHVLRL